MGIASGQRARPSARPGPCIVQADSKSHTCKLKICISVSFHILVGEAVPLPWTWSRSKKPASLLHPAAALMGSEGSQTAWAVNFTSLVLIISIHHDLAWLAPWLKFIYPGSKLSQCWTFDLVIFLNIVTPLAISQLSVVSDFNILYKRPAHDILNISFTAPHHHHPPSQPWCAAVHNVLVPTSTWMQLFESQPL